MKSIFAGGKVSCNQQKQHFTAFDVLLLFLVEPDLFNDLSVPSIETGSSSDGVVFSTETDSFGGCTTTSLPFEAFS